MDLHHERVWQVSYKKRNRQSHLRHAYPGRHASKTHPAISRLVAGLRCQMAFAWTAARSKLERARAINTNEYQIGRLFDELERALAVVKPRSLWNCDESGFSAWSAEGGRLVYGFRGSKAT